MTAARQQQYQTEIAAALRAGNYQQALKLFKEFGNPNLRAMNEVQTLKAFGDYAAAMGYDVSPEAFEMNETKIRDAFEEKYIEAAKKSDYNINDSSDSSIFEGIIGKQTGMTIDYKNALNQKFSNGSETAKKAFNKFVPSDSVADAAFTGTACFNPRTMKINMNYTDDLANKRGSGTTFFHEHGHLVDFMAVGASNYNYLSTSNQTFGALLQSDFNDYVNTYKKQHNMNLTDAYSAISFELMGHDKHSLSDLIDGISNGRCGGIYAHKRSYWTKPGALEKEAFAHMFEASFNSVKYSLMKKYFPNALAEFENMLKGVI